MESDANESMLTVNAQCPFLLLVAIIIANLNDCRAHYQLCLCGCIIPVIVVWMYERVSITVMIPNHFALCKCSRSVRCHILRPSFVMSFLDLSLINSPPNSFDHFIPILSSSYTLLVNSPAALKFGNLFPRPVHLHLRHQASQHLPEHIPLAGILTPSMVFKWAHTLTLIN